MGVKRYLLVLLLALVGAVASFAVKAQDAIGPCTSSAAPPAMPASSAPFAMPKGYTYSLSTCTAPIVSWNANGAALGWGCRDGPKVYIATYAVRHSAITPEMVKSFSSIPFASDWKQAAQQHWQTYGTQHFLGMADVWCEASGSDWRIRFNDAVRPLIVEARAYAGPVWKTPATGVGTLYKVVGGKRSYIISGRTAPPGAECDCRSPITYMTSSFCPLKGAAADEVTLCRQAP